MGLFAMASPFDESEPFTSVDRAVTIRASSKSSKSSSSDLHEIDISENKRSSGASTTRKLSGSTYRSFEPFDISSAGEKDEDVHVRRVDRQTSKPLAFRKLVALNAGNFGAAFLWFGLQIQTIPSQIRALAGESKKGTYLGIVVGCGAIVTFFLSPLVGNVADRYGKRLPPMMVGMIATAVSLLLLGAASPHIPQDNSNDAEEEESDGTDDDEPLESWGLGGYLFVFLLMQTSYLVLSVPYQAHLAEATPKAQRGRSSGVNASMASGGMLLSAAIGIAYHRMPNVVAAYSIPCIFMIASYTVVAFAGPADRVRRRRSPAAATRPRVALAALEKESDVQERNEAAWDLERGSVTSWCRRALNTYLAPFQSRDFFWVFFTRFLMQQGVSTISWFLEYFLADVVDLGSVEPETAVSYAFLPMLLASGLSSALGGWLSDRWGKRKSLVIASSFIMSACSFFAAVWARTLAWVCVVMFFFGCGYGIFLSVDFALVMDVLPSDADVSRDMAIWHNALVIPQLLATPIGGAIRDGFSGEKGYVILFLITCVYFSLSAFFVTRIRGAK